MKNLKVKADQAYIVRSPELNVSILAFPGQSIQWFIDLVLSKGGTFTAEKL